MVQQQPEQYARAHTTAQDRQVWEKDGKEMVRVPAGEFLYGENKTILRLPEFWIDKTPVTNAEFARFVQASGYKTTAELTGVGRAYSGGKWEDGRHPRSGLATPWRPRDRYSKQSRSSGSASELGRCCCVCQVGWQAAADRAGMGKGGARHGWRRVPVGKSRADARAVQFQQERKRDDAGWQIFAARR